MGNLGYIILFLIVAVFASWLIARAKAPKPKPEVKPEPEPKRFGLREAEAAVKFVTTSGQVQSVLGVVVGVLGYENAVAEDVQTEVNRVDSGIAANDMGINVAREEINALNYDIRRLERANEESLVRRNWLQRLTMLFATK